MQVALASRDADLALPTVAESDGALEPRVSIVIPTCNNLVFVTLCLRSLLANTEYPGYEVVVIDNGSTDGTPGYLRELMGRHPRVRGIFNEVNRGFAAANNQGLAVATGDVLVLLNDDTMVPPGLLLQLVKHLDDPDIGLVGPVTNRAGNEAQIETSYRTYGEMVRFTGARARTHAGQLVDLRTLTMFCVAMRRDLWERVGPLDEQFEFGMFEDEDYAMRVQAAGYRVVCAEDSFVHHFGQASLGKLAATDEYGPLFHANRKRWEEKWGRPWEPYRHRPSQSYQQLVERTRTIIQASVPRGATVLVASKGDEALLELEGRRGWHFPRTEEGDYCGHHPANSTAAIRELEGERDKGARYLVLPMSAIWWLDHYHSFRDHMEMRYARLTHEYEQEEDGCVIFDLTPRDAVQLGHRPVHSGQAD